MELTTTYEQLDGIIERAFNKGLEMGKRIGYNDGQFDANRDAHQQIMEIVDGQLAVAKPSPLAIHPETIHEDETAIYICGGYRKEEPKTNGFRL